MSESDHEQLLSAGLVRRREDSEEFQPYVPHNETQKEITVRAVLLSLVLAVILGSANVYLGLFAGLTVSASIPAAIISMSVLRTLFKDVSILENNLVQTGEARCLLCLCVCVGADEELHGSDHLSVCLCVIVCAKQPPPRVRRWQPV